MNCTFCCIPFDSSSTRRRRHWARPSRSSHSLARWRAGEWLERLGLEPFPCPLARPPPIDAFHLAEKYEHVEHPHLAVQAALLREVADPPRVGSPPTGLPEYPHGAAVRLHDGHGHTDGRRPPGGVWP